MFVCFISGKVLLCVCVCVCVCFFQLASRGRKKQERFCLLLEAEESGQTLRSIWDRNVSLKFRFVAAYNEMFHSLCSQRILGSRDRVAQHGAPMVKDSLSNLKIFLAF